MFGDGHREEETVVGPDVSESCHGLAQLAQGLPAQCNAGEDSQTRAAPPALSVIR